MGERSLPMMGFTLLIVFLSKAYLDAKNPQHVMAVRMLYAISQLLCGFVLLYLLYQSKKNKEDGLVVVHIEPPFGEETNPEYLNKTEKLSISVYDVRECHKQMRQILLALCVTTFIHMKWGFVPPLLIQSFIHPISLFNSSLSKIYLRQQRAWGELRRPWNGSPNSHANALKKWNSFTETWTAAISGKPIIRKNIKKKEEKINNKKKN